MAVANELIDAGPGLVRCPFTILIDRQEKAPFSFAEIRARSFIDKDQRLYVPCVERRYLGVGMGDYSLAGYEGRIGIERKSLADFQGTLLGWEPTWGVRRMLEATMSYYVHEYPRTKATVTAV